MCPALSGSTSAQEKRGLCVIHLPFDFTRTSRAQHHHCSLPLSPVSQTPLSTLPGLDAPSLSAMFARLDDFLVSLDVEVAQGLARLSNSKVAASVSRRACRKFVEAYGLLCRAVHDPASGYRNPKEIVRRDAREVEMILFGGA